MLQSSDLILIVLWWCGVAIGFTDAFGVRVPWSSSMLSLTAPKPSSSIIVRFQEGSSTDRSKGISTDSPELQEESINGEGISFDSLIDMDVVIYSIEKVDTTDGIDGKPQGRPNYCLGALQENGYLAPLSAWTTEPAFGKSLEFLVDEDDRFALIDATTKTSSNSGKAFLRLHYRLNQYELSYGSRQCHRGVGNPHGEESELLYYVDESVVDKFDIQVVVKPELEILW